MNLTKTLQLTDLDHLTTELAIVDRHFTREREQHPNRRWEYSMAIRAYDTWQRSDIATPNMLNVGYDIGGAGSPFFRMLPLTIVDPDVYPHATLAQWIVKANPPLADAVFCLSVLEHVEDVNEFLYHLSCLVRPGGLLFLTMDITADDVAPETVHFAHMRNRIFSPRSWLDLARVLERDGDFTLLGDADFNYHGHTLYGSYSFASLAMVKRS